MFDIRRDFLADAVMPFRLKSLIYIICFHSVSRRVEPKQEKILARSKRESDPYLKLLALFVLSQEKR